MKSHMFWWKNNEKVKFQIEVGVKVVAAKRKPKSHVLIHCHLDNDYFTFYTQYIVFLKAMSPSAVFDARVFIFILVITT